MNLDRIKAKVLAEMNNPKRQLKKLEFNVRGSEVVMNYVMGSETFEMGDPHFIRHTNDPEWLTLDEMNAMLKFADENGVSTRVRDDEFI